jgi:histidine phosphotransferase ChpT
MDKDLARLVGSRICHDLISPIGAISNGVELIGMTQDTGSAEFGLINDSVDTANAKIRFFRVAFGAGSPSQMIGRNEVLSILADSARGGRLNYFWQVEDDLVRRDARIAFLLLQCIENALPHGGSVTISEADGTWSFIGTGEKLKLEAELWDSLTNEFSLYDHTASQVQFALLPDALRDAGKTLEVNVIDHQLAVTLRPL